MFRVVDPSIQLIVGLGNPGLQYRPTRHNAGVRFVEALAETHHLDFHKEDYFDSLLAEWRTDHSKVYLLLPQTYMNLSGEAVLAAANYYKISPEHILIAHDELDLPCGTARLKLGGGDGGHNGLKDIISKLNTKNFWRLRLGIARPPELFQQNIVDYVLGKPTTEEKENIVKAIHQSVGVSELLVQGKIDKAMQKLHTL